jgi:hypothetical protein
MIMLWAIFKKRVFFLYMVICVVGTIILAYSFQYLVFVPNVDTDNPLLRNISSISGGSSAVISKVDRNVKIVMNPGGKNMVATYENDLEGRGAIVFDSGFERFINASSGKYDNDQYITNIAKWLEEHNNSFNEGTILIYNTFNKSGLDNSSFSENVPMLLSKNNELTVTITDRRETPELTEAMLEHYSQVWIIMGESGRECCFSDAELELISRFAEDGSSMLIVAGKTGEGAAGDWTAANRMSSRFGVTFYDYVDNGEELQISSSTYFFNRISDILRRLYGSMT